MTYHKIVVLGNGGVGKTALIVQFTDKKFITAYDPTIEDLYKRNIQVGNNVYPVTIIDTAGQEEYSAMKDQYIRYGNSFILMYSITAKETFEEMELIKRQIKRVKEVNNVPMILVGNKIDLDYIREVEHKEGFLLAKLWNVPFLEISVKNGINVEKVFVTVMEEVLKLINQNEKKKKKNKCLIL